METQTKRSTYLPVREIAEITGLPLRRIRYMLAKTEESLILQAKNEFIQRLAQIVIDQNTIDLLGKLPNTNITSLCKLSQK